MIKSWGDQRTAAVFNGKKVPSLPPSILKTAIRKLDMLHAAMDLRDLRSPPNNRLKALRGDLKGRHSIRINDQWRVVFRWQDGAASDVEIVDYH